MPALVAVGLSWAALLGAVPPASASDSAPPEPARPPAFRAEVFASAWLASLTGSLQTPSGGRAGTTSPQRPTLEEIGLEGLRVLPQVDARFVLFDAHELHLAFAWMGATGSAVLEDALVSQAVLFPAGSAVESSLELPLAKGGYRAHWLPLAWGAWRVAPEIGFAYANFDYQLASSTVAGRVDRRYGFGFPYLGLWARGALSERLRFEADVAGSVGINGVSFADADFRLAWRFLQRGRFSSEALLGLRGVFLYRKDGQEPEQNDIDVRAGSFSDAPWAGFHLGLRVGF